MRKALAVLIALAALPVALAQEPVLLQRKFTLGQEVAYRLTVTGLAAIESDAPEGMGLPTGDAQLDLTAEFAQRVEALGQGWAELAVRLEQASLDANLAAGAFEAEFHIKLPEGDVQVLFNGQPAPQEEKPKDLEPLLALARLPILVRTDPAGRIVGLPQLDLLTVAAPQLDLQAMQAASTGFLPTRPVSVGDAWKQRQALPLALPAPDGTKQKEIVLDYALKELTKLEDRDVARIGVTGKFAVGDMRGFRWPGKSEAKPKEGEPQKEPAGLESLNAEIGGNIYFDWHEGQVVRADLTVKADARFSEWKKPPAQPDKQPQETVEAAAPILIHTALKDIELTITLERIK